MLYDYARYVEHESVIWTIIISWSIWTWEAEYFSLVLSVTAFYDIFFLYNCDKYQTLVC